jgi:hypothetical protein
VITFVEDRLPAAPPAVPRVRHALAVALLTEVTEDVLSRTLLLATEAASSALATEDPWRLEVELDDFRLRVTVRHDRRDIGDGAMRRALFDSLSDRWGAEPDAIWFEIRRR